MKTLAGTILLVAVLGLFAFTNPKMDSYVQFVRGEAVRAQAARGQQDDGLFAALFKLYGTLYSDSGINRSIIEATVRKDYVFFSLYDSKGTGAGGQHVRFLGILNNFFPPSGQLAQIQTEQSILTQNARCENYADSMDQYNRKRASLDQTRAALRLVAQNHTPGPVVIDGESYTFEPMDLTVYMPDGKRSERLVMIGQRKNGGEVFSVLIDEGQLMMLNRIDNVTVEPLTDQALGFEDIKAAPPLLTVDAFCAGAGQTDPAISSFCETFIADPTPTNQAGFCGAVKEKAKQIKGGNLEPQTAQPTTLNGPREAFPAAAIAATAHWQITGITVTELR